MMHALFGVRSGGARPGLADFQSDAVVRLGAILDRFGGAFLCDSVGLGKTHVAAAIIADATDTGAAVLVTGPAPLRTLWAHQLRRVHGWTWISHTQLSRHTGCLRRPRGSFELIVADEAHAFRNAATRRYHALARMALGSRVLLITATPVNNTLLDFYHLLRLFAADDAFVACGVPDVRSEVEAALAGRPHQLRRIVQHVVVRRTRADVCSWQRQVPETGTRAPLGFPTSSATCLVDYDLDAVYAGRLRSVCEQVEALTFAAHTTASGAPAELMRLGLLKRLESSSESFEQSILRLLRLTDMFCSAADAGLMFDAGKDAALAAPVDGALQLTLHHVALPPWPRRLDRRHALRTARHDLALLSDLQRTVGAAIRRGDPKRERLRQLVGSELAGEKVVVFTEFRASAQSLWRALERDGGVACVHGGEARLGRRRASRRAVIQRFAPLANHAAPPREREAVRVLITTDVLSEGVNLQDARICISYDLPWNPVRLAQRAGRIDRLGSLHSHIEILAFRPARQIESVLGLMRRIRVKLHGIRSVGGDTPAPFTSRDRQRAAHAITDPAASARERARSAFAHSGRPTGARGRAVALWPGPEATLCCVRSDARTALVLVRSDGALDVDGAAAWNALRHAFAQHTGEALDADALRQLAAAESAALRSATHTHHHAATTSDRTRRRGIRIVRTWLLERPGGPTDEEFRHADAMLALLQRRLRAGAELELRALVRSHRTRTAIPALIDLATRAPDRIRDSAAPEIVAAVLFRTAP